MLAARVATRFLEASEVSDSDLIPTLQKVLQLHDKLKDWSDKFPGVLANAKKYAVSLPEGWVWQQHIAPFLREFEDKFETWLGALDETLQVINVRGQRPIAKTIANVALRTTYPEGEASLANAISGVGFFDHPDLGKDRIAYKIRTLTEWHKGFQDWTTRSTRILIQESKRAKKAGL